MLDQLRKKIARIERRPVLFQPMAGDRCKTGWRLGCDAIDTALPGGRLGQGDLHDFCVAQTRHIPAMDRFVLALLQLLPRAAETGGPIIWCQTGRSVREYGHPYAPGLKAAGLAPERLVHVVLRKQRDLAFVMEESLRSGAVAAIIGEGAPVGFTATRRLSLACLEMAIPCLFLNVTGTREASAATTRWRIAPAIGPPDENDPLGPGPTVWSVQLTRARGGRAGPGSWKVYWNDETHSFNLVSAPGDAALADSRQARPALRITRGERKTG